MKNRENVTGIAARAAMWSARHRALAILGWIAFVVGVTVLSGQIGAREATSAEQGHGDSGRADRIVEAAGFPERQAGELVLVQNRAGTERSAAIADVTKALGATANVTGIKKPIESPDGTSSLISFSISGNADTAKDRVGPALDTVERVQAAHPGLYIAEAGDASGDKLIGDALDRGLERLSLLSIPVTLSILLVAFGAVVAALLPVALAVTAVVAAAGCGTSCSESSSPSRSSRRWSRSRRWARWPHPPSI